MELFCSWWLYSCSCWSCFVAGRYVPEVAGAVSIADGAVSAAAGAVSLVGDYVPAAAGAVSLAGDYVPAAAGAVSRSWRSYSNSRLKC